MPARRITNPGIIVVGDEKGSVKCGVKCRAWSETCEVWSVKSKV